MGGVYGALAVVCSVCVWCVVWNTLALKDSAQPGVLHIVEAHERNFVRQILVEARARDAFLDLEVTSFRYQCNAPRLKLLAAMLLAL